jgi:predicted anti-sigma-YlaC factor YlaD
MTCPEAREFLLTADLDRLEATGGPLADHLAACPTCRAAATRIVQAHRALRAAVPAPRRAGRLIAERAIAEGRAAMRRRRRIVRRAVPTLLAAAAIGAVLLVPRDRLPRGTIAPATPNASLPPLVAASSTDVAVIATSRPDITIIWQF